MAQNTATNPDAHKLEELTDGYDMAEWKVRRMNISLNHMNSDHSGQVMLQD